MDTLTFFLFALVASTLAYLAFGKSRSKYPLPPGPKGLPIIGNLHQIPRSRPWVQLAKWSRQYGPVYRLRMGRTDLIVLGTAQAALDLLDRRSAIYSSRPRLIMTSELVSRGLRMTFMQYGELWRKERKLLHQLTSPKAASSYEPIQDGESAWLIKDLLENPRAFWGHGQRYAGSSIMQIAFNKRALKHSDPAITEMRNVNEQMTKTAVPGRYMVDSLPFLNYLPRSLAPWKEEADTLFAKTLKLFQSHMDDVKKNVSEGRDSHCFAKSILELQGEYGLTDEEATFLAGAMYGAGSDTTADAIATFIFTMAAHPEVMKKGQEEIDRVIGRDRMPDFADEPALIYLQAIIREILRWRSVIAGGLGHSTIEDDVYNGYFIPKGSTVLGCHWSIHNDPEVYPNPEKYIPERFIKDGGLIGTKYSERGHHAFGFGRRVCPGQHIAERSLFIVYSRILWAFNVTPAYDENGKQYPLDVDAFSEGFSSHPRAFKCNITPRDASVKDIVRAAVETTVEDVTL